MGTVGDAAMDIVHDAATMCNRGFALIFKKMYLDEFPPKEEFPQKRMFGRSDTKTTEGQNDSRV